MLMAAQGFPVKNWGGSASGGPGWGDENASLRRPGCIEFPANRENIREFSHFRPFPAPFRQRPRQFALQFQCVAVESLLRSEQRIFPPEQGMYRPEQGAGGTYAKHIEGRSGRAYGGDQGRRRGGGVLRGFGHDGGGHGV